MDQPAMRPASSLTDMPVVPSTCLSRTRALSLVLAVIAATVGSVGVADAQTRVKTPAAILSAPNGRAIGSVRQGAELRVLETRGAFARVSVDGFVERARISGQRGSSSPRVGSRAAVLRSKGASAARTVASLDAGTVVSVASGSAPAGWVRISRTGWVLRASLNAPASATRGSTTSGRAVAAKKPPRIEPKSSAGDVAASPMAAALPTATSATAPTAVVAGSSTTAPVPDTSESALAPKPAAPPTAGTPNASSTSAAPLSDSALVPTSNVALRAAPDARPLATVAQGTTLIPLARDRGWVRVRVEGWVAERDLAPADTSVRAGVSAADLRADPQGSRGKVVRWTVQVLARQTADALRRDLAANETYLLARGPYEENALLYLVVPPALLESSKSIATLTNVTVTARVRTGKSELVGVPILDLLTITSQK